MYTTEHMPLTAALPIASAFAFLGMAFPILWPLVILGVAGYLFTLLRVTRKRSAVAAGLIFGAASGLGGIWWFLEVLPLSWLSIPPGIAEGYLVVAVMGLTMLALALPFALSAPAILLVRERFYKLPAALALYVLSETLRPWFFALFFLGPESTLEPHFSVAGLGYALAESSFLLPAAQLGATGLIAVLALLGGTLAAFFAFESKKVAYALGAGTLAILIVAYLALPQPATPAQTMRVALASTHLPPGPVVDPSPILTLLNGTANEPVSLVVLPEGFGLQRFLPGEARSALYQALYKNRDVLIVSSAVVQDADGRERAELLYESSTRGVLASQDKMFFVPIGEYLPPLLRAAISLAGSGNLGGYETYLGAPIVRGTEAKSASVADVTVGALTCSEILSSSLYRSLGATEDTDLLINVANNSWFHGSRLLHARLKQLAKVHAVENRQHFLVAANDSPAYAIDPRGNLVAEMPWDESGFLFVDVPVTP